MLVSGLAFLVLFSLALSGMFLIIGKLKQPVITTVLPWLGQYISIPNFDLTKAVDSGFWLLEYAISANSDAIFAMLFMVIGVPYLAWMSKKAHAILHPQGTLQKPLTDTFWRGLKVGFKTGVWQLLAFMVISGLGFIPLVDTFTPLLSFGVQAYFNGIVMVDYALEQNNIDARQSVWFFKTNKASIAGIGLGFVFLLLIPVVGWFLAPTYALIVAALFVKQPQPSPSKNSDWSLGS